MALPADSHVHSQWSWDARLGDMEATCERALDLGLPAVVFTEHLDFSHWWVEESDLVVVEHLREYVGEDGELAPPMLDLTGYISAVHRCRILFPGLHILTGVEFGDPHRNADEAEALLETVALDRVLGSLHTLRDGDRLYEPPGLFRRKPAPEVMRDYLAEASRLIQESDVFDVFAHIDYAVRYWPRDADPFEPRDFEEPFRRALRLLAGSGRALEVNTRVPMAPTILDWWREEGGAALSFGSDAHDPSVLARGLAEAAELAEEHGFRPGAEPGDLWVRTP